MSDNLANLLSGVGKATEAYETSDGTRLLLLPYGARVLGLYAPESDENFFWTNPVLDSAESARAMYESDDWHNSGGERIWLGPEVDIFFPNYPDLTTHVPPEQLDASDYDVARNPLGVQMSRFMNIELARPQLELQLCVSKGISQALNPLRYEKEYADVMTGVEYAGFTQTTSLELTLATIQRLLEGGFGYPARLGLWSLIQLPHGGEMLVPTYSRTEPKVIFGDIPQGDLISEERLVRFKTRSSGAHKIGIRAVATTGRAAYMHQTGDRWALVIRNFFVNPSGEYVDVPLDDQDDLGYSVQAVCLDNELGKFCELEYHTPAVGHGTQASSYKDISQVWAFRGERDEVIRIARKLLSPDV